MAGSAISTPTYKALIGNVFNQDGSTPVYSAGAFTWKNSSGTTTFAVDSAGAVTLGPSSGLTGVHRVNGSILGTRTGSLSNSMYYSSGISSILGANVYGTASGTNAARTVTGAAYFEVFGRSSNSDNCFSFVTNHTDAQTADSTYVGTNQIFVGVCTMAGAWTLGPSGFTGTHVLNGAAQITVRNASSSNVAAYFTSAGILSITSSSERYKENIVTSPASGLDIIDKMRVVEFDYKNDDTRTRKLIGLIAEEVNEYLPNMVQKNEDGLCETVYYQDIPLYLVKAFQEQQAIIEALKTRLSALEAKP